MNTNKKSLKELNKDLTKVQGSQILGGKGSIDSTKRNNSYSGSCGRIIPQ
jgi:hypothetical protein